MSMFQELPLSSITESPTNPRKTYGDLKELTDSIKEKGILQPILVRPKGKGHEIVFGHCRYRAAQAAGLEKVPAIVREMTDEAALEAQLIENCQRQDIHPMEEAEGYQRLLNLGHDAARIAAKLGKSVKYVYDRTKLLNLAKAGQELFRAGKITAGHAILLARLKPADQARAIGKPGEGPLLVGEQLLGYDERRDDIKAISVRELQAWIDGHVRFDDEHVDPMLFPETAQAVTQVREEAEKIVPITRDYHVIPEAKQDGTRTYGPMSWKRADGQLKSKACEYSVTGVIVVGLGRGEAFKVCIEKKKCKVHWAEAQREAKKRAGAAAKGRGKTATDNYEVQRRKQEAEYRRAEEERKRWEKATPAILKAVAEAIKKASARPGGPLAGLLLSYAPSRRTTAHADLVALGTTAEDLVRHLAFLVLCDAALDRWSAAREFPKHAKAVGVDAKKILDEVAPPAPPPAVENKPKVGKKAGKPAAKKKGGRK